MKKKKAPPVVGLVVLFCMLLGVAYFQYIAFNSNTQELEQTIMLPGEREYPIDTPINLNDPKWQFLKSQWEVLKDFPTKWEEDWDIYVVQPDLNDDGIPETFVYVQGSGACGGHNCPLAAYRVVAGQHVKIIDISGPSSFFVLPTTHNGFHDLSFLPPDERKYVWQFDGSEYQ